MEQRLTNGQKLRFLRCIEDKTIEELAKELHVSARTVYRYEMGYYTKLTKKLKIVDSYYKSNRHKIIQYILKMEETKDE